MPNDMLSRWRAMAVLSLFCSAAVQAQPPVPQAPSASPAYAELSAGMNFLYLRDAGVSPLLYSGPLFYTQGAFVKETNKMEWRADFGFATGEIEKARAFVVSSDVTWFTHGFSALREVSTIWHDRIRLLGGLHYHGFSSYRVTPAFRNNSSVVESVNSLFASMKAEWNFQKDFRPRKFLFIKRKGGIRAFRLSTQYGIPLLNASWRPGFAYLDDFTGGENSIGRDNELQFGGQRFLNRTEFHYYLRNGNAWKLSYFWDIQRSPGDFNRFETAQHIAAFSLLFKLN